MVSPGAEAQSGRKLMSLGKVPPYAQYLHATDSRPIDVTVFGNGIRGMIGAEYEVTVVTQIEDDMFGSVIEFAGLTSDEIADSCGTAKVSQSVLEDFGGFVAQLVAGVSFTLTDRPKLLSLEGDFQGVNSSA